MRGRTLALTSAALLVPALALADDDQTPVPDPAAPADCPAPTTTPPVTAQATPAPTAPPAVIVTNPTEPQPAIIPAYAPPPINYDEGRLVTDLWNEPLFYASAAVFAGSYGGSIIVAAGSHKTGDDNLYIPVVGPWLDLWDRDNCSQSMNTNCDSGDNAKALLMLDGVVQGVALVGLVSSFVFPTHHREVTGTASLRIVPTATTTQAGLSVHGRF